MKIHNLNVQGTGSGFFSGSFSGDGSEINNLDYNYLPVPGNDRDILINDGGFIGATGTFEADSLYVSGSMQAGDVSSSYIQLDSLTNGTAPTHSEGIVYYDSEEGSLTVYNDEADISLQVGQEFWIRARNETGVTITNGTPVYISGSQGDNPLIHPAVSEDHTDEMYRKNHIIGLATHDIENNTVGYVTEMGILRGFDTSGFSSGSILYLQTGSSGLRDTPPPFPYDVVQVGFVVRVHTNGFIFVMPNEPVHFHDISGLSGSINPTDSSVWVYESSSSKWYDTNVLPDIVASGSFSGSFVGDGSQLSGVTSYTDSDTLSYINSIGVISGSDQINQLSDVEASGSFSGSFVGDGSGLTGISATPWTSSGADIYFNTGNVGIGTTSPDNSLHIEGGGLKIKGNTPLLQFEDSNSTNPSQDLFNFTLSNSELRLQYLNSSSVGGGSYLQIARTNNNVTSLDMYNAGVLKNSISTSGNSYFTSGKLSVGTPSSVGELTVKNTGGNYDSGIRILSNNATSSNWARLDIDHLSGVTGSTGENSFTLYQGSSGEVGIRNLSPKPVRFIQENTNVNGFFEFITQGTLSSDSVFRIQNDGKIGIGTTSPNAKLDIRGSNTANGVLTMAPDDTSNYKYGFNIEELPGDISLNIGFKEKSNPLFTSVITLDQQERVGIGTKSPNAKLDIANGDIRLSNTGGNNNPSLTIYSETGNTSDYFKISDNADTQVVFTKANSSGHILMDFDPIPGDGTSDVSMRLFRLTNTTGNSNFYILPGDGTAGANHTFRGNGDCFLNTIYGNTGIGTTSPNTKLHVLTDDLPASAGSEEKQLRLETNSGNVDYLNFYSRRITSGSNWISATHYIQRQVDSTRMGYIRFGGVNSDPISFGTGLTERMRIDNSGNVGINTTNPTEILTVEGGNVKLSNGSNDLLILPQSAPTISVGGSADATIFRKVPDSTYYNHIGFEIPANDSNDGFFILTDADVDGTVDTVAMKIKANGDTGIGTTNPQSKLDVVGGQVRSTRIAGENQYIALSSIDASGNKLIGSSRRNNQKGLTIISQHDGVGTPSGDLDIVFKIGEEGSVDTKLIIEENGDVVPGNNASQDLGSTTKRWNTVYTSDLSLKNDLGDWTIVEGSDDLFLYNNKRDKVYKFKLEEVTKEEAPAKRT